MGLARIIALDLGKFKTVACVRNAVDRSHVFETIEMSPAAVHDLLARHAADPAGETLVVFETCDRCGWVYDINAPQDQFGVGLADGEGTDLPSLSTEDRIAFSSCVRCDPLCALCLPSGGLAVCLVSVHQSGDCIAAWLGRPSFPQRSVWYGNCSGLSVRVFSMLLILGVLSLFFGCEAAPGGRAAWIARQGGLQDDGQQARAESVLNRLVAGHPQIDVKVRVLASQGVCAYAWPDRTIFVTAGLMARADDDVLAAAIAHELGHLLSDGQVNAIASLNGCGEGADAERRADAFGLGLLELQQLPPRSMSTMLGLVRDANVLTPTCRRAMTRRIEILDTSLRTASAAP